MALLSSDGDRTSYYDAEGINDGSDEQQEGSTSTLIMTSSPGAPIEIGSPIGRQITLFSAVMLNVGAIIGSGIFAVPGTILNSVGSIGVALSYWILAPLFALSGLAIYAELAAMFPNRSGAEVVYLEQAYPKPRHLVSTVFAITAILTPQSLGNAVTFAQYFLAALDLPVTPANQTQVAAYVLLTATLIVGISTKWSLRIVDFLTSLKLVSLVSVVLTGLAVLFGFTSIGDPYVNFKHPFEGTSPSPNALVLGLVKAAQSCRGWENIFGVLGEVKSHDPVRIARKSSAIALALTSSLFFLINVSYIAAVPKDEIKNSGQLVAGLFFRRVYGDHWGAKILSLFVALSCFGCIVAATIGHARVIREIARQGLLPYSSLLASTKPFGTPLGPALIRGGTDIFAIILLPAKDAFNFVFDLSSYPYYFFQCAIVVGVWLLRKRRRLEGISPSPLQAKNSDVVIYLSYCLLLVAVPWVPPEPGHGDVSFWYATYCVVAVLIILAAGAYYWMWMILFPDLGGYEVVEVLEESPDGAKNKRFVKKYKTLETQPLLGASD